MFEERIKNSDIQTEYKEKLTSSQNAVNTVKSGDRIYVGICSSMAYKLCEALMEREDPLTDVEIQSAVYVRPASFFKEEEKNASVLIRSL